MAVFWTFPEWKGMSRSAPKCFPGFPGPFPSGNVLHTSILCYLLFLIWTLIRLCLLQSFIYGYVSCLVSAYIVVDKQDKWQSLQCGWLPHLHWRCKTFYVYIMDLDYHVFVDCHIYYVYITVFLSFLNFVYFIWSNLFPAAHTSKRYLTLSNLKLSKAPKSTHN